ncbi:lysophospholipid acyltransferase family protein [Nibricoccus aquaticus]|nr:lysophospholipid acyltransferase family protein [Nibricoccus aquaticus]
MGRLRYCLLAVAYYLPWLWFGAGGVLLNVVCTILLFVPNRHRLGPGTRLAIKRMFIFWRQWCHATHIFRVTWRGFDNQKLSAGTIYVANHPSLVDAQVLISALPDAICIFKPALLRNPAIGPAALIAGYASGGDGLDAIRDASDKVAEGRSLVIFPEGTRTAPGQRLNPLKPGFALIARRARAPIRLITIEVSRNLTTKGRAWWKLPALPTWMIVTLGEEIPADTPLTPTEITAYVAKKLTASATPVAPLS